MQSTFFHDTAKPRLQLSEEELPRLQIRITRYAGRHWAVYLNGDLLAVTVYKKGAIAVGNALARSEGFDLGLCNEKRLSTEADENGVRPILCRQYLDNKDCLHCHHDPQEPRVNGYRIKSYQYRAGGI